MLPQQHIDVLLLDVDGVLTDGSLPYRDGQQSGKTFLAQDGAMIKYAQAQGLVVGIMSGRASDEVAQRAQELGMHCCSLGIADKVVELKSLCTQHQWDLTQVAYIGDDIPDIEICRAVGVSFAVADASPQLRRVVDHISQANGGRGAVAEIIEAILRQQGQWNLSDDTLAHG